MANAGAGVDVVVAERCTYELLYQIDFFVGTARGGDAADGIFAVLGLDAAEFARGIG